MFRTTLLKEAFLLAIFIFRILSEILILLPRKSFAICQSNCVSNKEEGKP